MRELLLPHSAPQLVMALVLGLSQLHAATIDEWQKKADAEAKKRHAAWAKAGYPDASSPSGEALIEAAAAAQKPELIEELLAGGWLEKQMIHAPDGGEKVVVEPVRAFKEFKAALSEEMLSSLTREDGWLARRITGENFEIWTSKHGWLFDQEGRVLHEAEPPRKAGIGREWYGAFLPDGNWITTDIDEMDGKLYFYNKEGSLTRTLTTEELAPKPKDGGANLIGWARSDSEGKGWVVNVGSETGWATVWIAADGPPRILKNDEPWTLCYPRALGPRGDPWVLSDPNDADSRMLVRTEAGHGPRVGFPEYTIDQRKGICIPNGNYVFGFWPGADSWFAGAERYIEQGAGRIRSRKFTAEGVRMPIVDKTWAFNADGKLTGWIAGRRIADANDHKTILIRLTADGRIVSLGPGGQATQPRLFTWKGGDVADAIALWDDLRLGLFVRGTSLVIGKW